MSGLLIGTEGGVFRLDEEVRPEAQAPPVRFLAAVGDQVVAVAQDGALWRREPDGRWRIVNERPVTEEVWSFAADPRLDGRLYLGVSPALLHRSDDGGRRWTACESVRRIPGYERWTFPPPPHIPHVRSIAPDPGTPGALYIGVEEGGVYRSPDGGATWQGLNRGLYWDVHTVVPAPDGRRLYATTGIGFHLSEDEGRQWRHVDAGLDRSYTVACVAADGQVFLAAAAAPPPAWTRGADAALYRSDDEGEHWTRLGRGLPPRFDMMVRAMAVTAGAVHAAAGGEVYASQDHGESWQLVARGLPAVHALAVLRAGR
jgi:hypothetical protein